MTFINTQLTGTGSQMPSQESMPILGVLEPVLELVIF